ncbi:hypothetical protein AAHE18_04G177700 [Arachis hypogaea]
MPSFTRSRRGQRIKHDSHKEYAAYNSALMKTIKGLIRTFKMMGNYALTFVAIGGVYIGVKQLAQNARMKRDLVNGAVGVQLFWVTKMVGQLMCLQILAREEVNM